MWISKVTCGQGKPTPWYTLDEHSLRSHLKVYCCGVRGRVRVKAMIKKVTAWPSARGISVSLCFLSWLQVVALLLPTTLHPTLAFWLTGIAVAPRLSSTSLAAKLLPPAAESHTPHSKETRCVVQEQTQRFLDLPAELRLRVCKFLPNRTIRTRYVKRSSDGTPESSFTLITYTAPTAILATYKTVNNEAAAQTPTLRPP
ncbi:hypothetical protein BKA58DRAFT_422182 [Alternaria rosae]|uniref:uncharacterized protein n=1 Tax=Alternaria rosae TaxID=1187941 RepID=UPI001E8DEF56|nr:uncharacterized protein BKA58DRAFT_422182 [Alternaria rosae]KAH6866441.1 hypothetical protein BKA58DRAFT_422182 [Alternaria rosae]